MGPPKDDYPFTMRVTQEDRRLFKRVADHHGLKIAQVIRMLVKHDDHRRSGRASPEASADAAWTAAMASFWQTGVTEKMGKVVAIEPHVKATAKALDEVMALAEKCGEPFVSRAVGAFREAVAAYPKLDLHERREASASMIALFLAEGHASQQMFEWASRRAHRGR